MSAIALQASGIRKSYAKNGRPLDILDIERQLRCRPALERPEPLDRFSALTSRHRALTRRSAHDPVDHTTPLSDFCEPPDR